MTVPAIAITTAGPASADVLDLPPTRTIVGGNTGLSLTYGVALDSGGLTYTSSNTGDSVQAFDSVANGNATPTIRVSGGNTLLNGPWGLAFDASGNLFVANSDDQSINVYPAGADGNVAPTYQIKGIATSLSRPAGLAFDASGNLYVSNYTGNRISVFAPGATGNATPTKTISGGSTGLSAPNALAIAPNGNIFVSNNSGNSVTVYSSTATGNASPAASIAGGNTGLNFPQGVAMDSQGHVYVSNFSGAVSVFAPGAFGNIAPLRQIVGAATGLDDPVQMAVDENDGTYIANAGNNSLTIYTQPPLPASPPAIPGTPTAVADGTGAVFVTVTPSADQGGTPDEYTVTASSGGAQCAIAATASPLGCKVTGLTPGATYTFTVTASNTAGTSAASLPSAPVRAGGSSSTVLITAAKLVVHGCQAKVTARGTDPRSSGRVKLQAKSRSGWRTLGTSKVKGNRTWKVTARVNATRLKIRANDGETRSPAQVVKATGAKSRGC